MNTSVRFGLAILSFLALMPSLCTAAEDAIAEVNAARARKGLPAFGRAECLTVAAKACADYRASKQMAGHTSNDFAYLPKGCKASAAGCAAWQPRDGWGSCCTYERYRYAGAAWAKGRDGRRYMHIFVRGRR